MSNQKPEVKLVHQGNNELGEGPLWLKDRNAICWVDILKQQVYEYSLNTKKLRAWDAGRLVSLLVETDQKNTLLLGLKGGLGLLDMEKSEISDLIALEAEKENTRTNDGGCDPRGDLWVETLDMDFKEGSGALYRLADFKFEKKISNTTLANGIVWSKDQHQMFFIDSAKATVYAYCYDPADGSLSDPKEVVIVPAALGIPDGMAIDELGMLWIAHYGGFGVFKWNPNTGELLEKIELPVPNVTACTFGGQDMKTLFITTARQELSEQELQEYPLSGSLFSFTTQVPGVEKKSWSLAKNKAL